MGGDNAPLIKDGPGNSTGVERIDVLGVNVINDDYMGDVVWITPLKIAEKNLAKLQQEEQTANDLPKCDGRKYSWNAVYKAADCLKMAEDIFLASRAKSREHELSTSRKRLQDTFNKNMTRLEFHTAVLEKCIDMLTGPRCGLNVKTTESADHDEMFICLEANTDSEVVKLIANSESYRAQVKPTSYPWNEREGKPTPVPYVDGKPCVAWTTYDIDCDNMFQGFRDIDKLRMVRRRIEHFINTVSLFRYGILTSRFVVHKNKIVTELRNGNFGSPYEFFKLPTANLDQVKNYFGEELTFFFHWFRFYTVQLMIPAFASLLLFSRHLFFDETEQQYIQDAFALFMALWAAQFCENYNRHAIIQTELWGTRDFDNVAAVRPDYVDDEAVDKKAHMWSTLGVTVMTTFLAIIVSGIAIIQSVRYVMVHHPTENIISAEIVEVTNDKELASKMGAKMGAMMITMQVKVLDTIWGIIAKKVTDNENHKTDARYQSSLVFKVVTVKFFNALYPFLYVAFAKEYVEGCKSPDGSCVFALQTCIIMFFVVHLGVTFAMLTKRIVQTRLKIRQEMQKPGIDPTQYTYLQLQAKCDSFMSSDMLPDYMELTVQFAMVTCFSVVLPVLVVLALISNLLEFRVIAYRQLYVLQRPHPTGAEGIGAWQSIFAAIATMAVIVNAGLAVFAMEPFRALDMEYRLLAFMIIEHMLIFTKMSVELAIPDLPIAVDKAIDKNEEAIAKMFGGGFKPVQVEHSHLPVQKALWCHPDGEKGSIKHTPFHLQPGNKVTNSKGDM